MSINYFPRCSIPSSNIANQNFSTIVPIYKNGINNNVLGNSTNYNLSQNKLFAHNQNYLFKHNNAQNIPLNNSCRYKIDKTNQLKRAINHSNTAKNIKAFEFKKNDIKSSGTLLVSSKSSKFNKVILKGKKIKNIDINEDENSNEDEESGATNPVNKDRQFANKTNNLGNMENKPLLKSSSNAKLNPIAKFINKILDKLDPSINQNKYNYQYQYMKYEEEIYRKNYRGSLNNHFNEIPNNNENINTNNQINNNLNNNLISKKKSIESSSNNNSNSNNQNNSLKQTNQSTFNSQKNSNFSSNKNSQQTINNNITNTSSEKTLQNLGDKKSISIKKEEDKKSESKTSSSKFPFQRLNDIASSSSSKISSNKNTIPNLHLTTIDEPFENNIVTNLGEYLRKENETPPMTVDMLNNKKGKGFRFCSELSQAGIDSGGKIKTDQDTSLISLDIGGFIGFNLFGVLDGHGLHGHFVSQYCKEYFIKCMTNYAELLKKTKGIVSAEEIYYELKGSKFSYICECFARVDSELMSQNYFDCNLSGTTCNLVIQINKHLICFSVGDSRGILVYDHGINKCQGILQLSTDHKPDLPGEIDRIFSCGGYVDYLKDMYGNRMGPPRVYKVGYDYPGLAMSRSLGDLQAKGVGVIPSPQIIEYDINDSTRYIVICSDGVWEFSSNEQVRDIANAFYATNDASGFCHELVKFAMNLWGQYDIVRDDITVVTVFF